MAFRNISVLLTANSTSLRSQLNQAATQVDRFSNKVQQHHKGVISSSKLMQAAVVGGAAAVAAGLAYAVVGAAQFEQRMRNVNSISALSEGQFKALGKSVLNLSTQVPQSANDLAEGLYDIASSGFQGANGLKVLNAAAVAASAGMSTTANSAKAITAVLNAYGRGADDAKDVSDVLFQTVNLGVISFDELTGVIGDVVGTAAAATVGIDQVGAAIATMTLTGLSGAESGTSLNRVLQSLLQPSESLAVLYKQLGYESGAAALKQKGLHGVIEDIRKATGGSIESLLALFPEIRSARGALALMANEGKNYTKVSKSIEDANARAGATMKAFKEQSKAVSFQFDIFKNKVNAGAIVLGTKLLPVVLQAMKAIGRFGTSAGEALKYLAPFFKNIAQIGVDLWTIIVRMNEALTPAARLLAGLVAAPIIAGLNTISGILADLVHFITENKVAFAATAAVLTTALLPALYRMAAALATQLFVAAVIGVSSLIGAFEGLTVAATTAAVAEAAATLGATAVIAAGILAFQSLRSTSKSARREVDELYDAMVSRDQNNPVMMSGSLNNLQKELDRKKKEAHALGTMKVKTGFTTTELPFRFNLHFGGDESTRANAKVDELRKKTKELIRDQRHVGDNLKQLAKDTGLSWSQLIGIADKEKINLRTGYNESADARQKVIDKIHEMEAASGLAGKTLAKVAGDDVAKMEALAKAIEETSKKASDAFMGANDVVSGFKLDDGEKAAKATATATDKLTKAQQKLADLEATQAAKKRLTVADDRALARARQAVADATKGVSKAEATKPDSKGAQLKAFYTTQLAESKAFLDGITQLTLKGLDPEMIKRLLEAGPKAAAPTIEALLSDHSGRLIKMANESEAKLREINDRVVYFARLTTIALNSASDDQAKNLGIAMQIQSQVLALGAGATVQAIAAKLGRDTGTIQKVADLFGITLGDGVKTGAEPGLTKTKAEIDAINAKLRRLDAMDVNIPVKLTGLGQFLTDITTAKNALPPTTPAGPGTNLLTGPLGIPSTPAPAAPPPGATPTPRPGTAPHPASLQRAVPVTGTAVQSASYTTVHQYEFKGDIVGVRMEDAERYAAQRRQRNNLAGAPA